MVRKHSVPDEEKWEMYQINVKQTYDDLDKAYAALELYFKRIELADLGKVPVPQNSDMPSSDDDILGSGRSSRIRKQKEIFSPPQPARRSRIVVEPNSPELTRTKQSRVTHTKRLSSKEAAECSRDIITNPRPPLNLDIMVSAKTDNRNESNKNNCISGELNGATVERPNVHCRKRNSEITAANTYVVAKMGVGNRSSIDSAFRMYDDHETDDDSDAGTAVNLRNTRGEQSPYNRLCSGSVIHNLTPNENEKKTSTYSDAMSLDWELDSFNEGSIGQTATSGFQKNTTVRSKTVQNNLSGAEDMNNNQQEKSEILKILKMQQRQINAIAKGSVYDITESSAVMEEMLPLDSMKKYFDFQENIKRKELQLDLINVLRGIGRANLKGIVRGALVMILSDKVARELNWEGGIKQNRPEKYRFGDSPLQTALFKAIKSNPAVQLSNTFEIKAIVTKWLSKAPERVANAEKKQERIRRR